MPFFSDYGYYHHGPSAPFSSQYYSQLLQPHLHHGGGAVGSRSVPRVQPRNYNSISVEQTLRAIRRGSGAAATRQRYAAAPHRPVHIDASAIDVTSPRRPARPAAPADEAAGGGIQRGRTVVRLHTVHKKAAAADGPRAADAQPPVATMPSVPEEGGGGGVAKKGTIKRHTSAGIKVPVDVNDDRRPSAVTDEILREQEALFDTMIMEEMEGGGGGGGGLLKKPRRKSYPADVMAAAADGKKNKASKALRKKSAADVAPYGGDAERLAKKAAAAVNCKKLNYDVIIEESGVESPVSFTFKLKKANKDGGGGGSDGKQLVDANHNVVVGGSALHDDVVKKHAKVASVKKPAAAVGNDKSNNNDVDNGRVGMLLVSDPAQQSKAKKKVIVKKKVVKKKAEAPAAADDDRGQAPQQQPLAKKPTPKQLPVAKQPTPKQLPVAKQPTPKLLPVTKHPTPKQQPVAKQPTPKQQRPAKPPQTPSPADAKAKKKKKKPSPTASKAATPAVITPFVRASFGKTFISPSQVSSTKSKFEKPKAKLEETEPSAVPALAEPPAREPPASSSSSSSSDDDDDDTSSADDESSSVCSGNVTDDSTDSSTYYYSSDYGKRIACSVSSFDSGLPSSPVPAPDPIDCDVNCHRKCEKLMPNLCGVNQKLVVEALATLKRDSSSSSDTAANPYQTGVGTADGTERPIRSYSYRHHSRPKRVVPPATSIPRFRKYAVDDFNFLKVLGKGSFGKVLLAELKGTDYYYAVKCLKKDVVLEDDDVECTLIERKVLALGTNHPYLCHLFCTFQTESHLFFVMEYLNGGDLMFHIQQSGRFDEGRSRFYASEIVSGLKFLHKKGIVYRDLKLDNILLDFNGHVRIADFGMCKLQIYLDKTADTFCGTPDYMAPEIIKGQKYNQSVDWWSFGILLYEMLVGKSPFSGCDEDALFWSICNEQPQYPRYLSVDAKSVLVALLEKDASKRLGSLEANHSAEDVIRHAFFSSMDWCKLERRELEPPYMPRVYHPLDTHYFDKHFTKEKPRLTPVDKTILQSMDQSQFDGFTYTNPNVTDS